MEQGSTFRISVPKYPILQKTQRSDSWRIAALQAKAEQIDRLQFSLAAGLTSEQAQLQAIQQRPPA
jgi:hypothetical protein